MTHFRCREQALPVIDIAPVVGELGWWPSELAMRAIDGLATTTGWPYWMSIAAITIGLRTMLFPLGLLTQRNSARMSVMRPEMDELRAAMEVRNTVRLAASSCNGPIAKTNSRNSRPCPLSSQNICCLFEEVDGASNAHTYVPYSNNNCLRSIAVFHTSSWRSEGHPRNDTYSISQHLCKYAVGFSV